MIKAKLNWNADQKDTQLSLQQQQQLKSLIKRVEHVRLTGECAVQWQRRSLVQNRE